MGQGTHITIDLTYLEIFRHPFTYQSLDHGQVVLIYSWDLLEVTIRIFSVLDEVQKRNLCMILQLDNWLSTQNEKRN